MCCFNNIIRYLTILCGSFYFSCNSAQGTTTFLKAATVIFRHGERNPIRSYPNDPYNATIFWPEGYGSMTQNGKRQVYELGQYLKRRYSQVSPENVVAFSSDRNRTLSSANLLLDGYFSTGSGYKGKVRVIPVPDDDFIFVSQPCPKYFELRDAYRKEKNIDVYGGWKRAVDIISHHTGMKFDSGIDVNLFFFADTILVQKSRNMTLPAWAEKLYKQGAIHGIKSFYYTSAIPTPDLTKLLTGAMMSRFLAAMDQVVELAEKLDKIDLDPTLTLISGHDTTIAFWLNNLDLSSSLSVPYAASLLLELHQGIEVNGRREFYIKVFYKTDSNNSTEPVEVKLPGCSNPCDYPKFKMVMQPKAISNRKEHCRLENDDEMKQDETDYANVDVNYDDSISSSASFIQGLILKDCYFIALGFLLTLFV